MGLIDDAIKLKSDQERLNWYSSLSPEQQEEFNAAIKVIISSATTMMEAISDWFRDVLHPTLMEVTRSIATAFQTEDWEEISKKAIAEAKYRRRYERRKRQ